MQKYVEIAQRLMRGAIDTHVHANPSYKKLNSSALEIVQKAKEAGMKAIVLKCDRFPTGGYAYLISQMVKGIKVYGMIVLNKFVGGLNIAAVQEAINLGEGLPGEYTRIVSMPTVSAPAFKDVERCIFASDYGGDLGTNLPPVTGLRIFIEDMIRHGMRENEIEIMKANAARLLGL